MESTITVNLPPDENITISIKEISEFIDDLELAPKTELNLALINLFKASLREMREFSLQRNDLTKTSLNVRNIFEIYLITTHVYSDTQGLKSWYGQMYKDMLDVRNGFRVLLKSKGMESAELDAVDEFSKNALDASPYESKGGFNLKDLATKYAYSEHYDFIYKLSSKLIHPTSMKVNGCNVIEDDKNYLLTMTFSGVFFTRKMEDLAISIKKKLNGQL